LTEENIYKKFRLAGLIREAEEQLYEDLPKDQTNRVYSGESENWKIVDYEIEASPVLFRTYEGTLYMKGQDEFQADYFKVEVHVVFEGNRDIKKRFLLNIQEENLEISKQSTGEFLADKESYTNKMGSP
jgi:hypothetical protein